MTLEDIKHALKIGYTVYWSNENYQVIKDSIGQYLIICSVNGHCVGLTNKKGQLVEDPESFYSVKV